MKRKKKVTRRSWRERGLEVLLAELAEQRAHQQLALQKMTAIGVGQDMSLVRIATALEQLVDLAKADRHNAIFDEVPPPAAPQ